MVAACGPNLFALERALAHVRDAGAIVTKLL
jgi:hypothetical protein